MLFLSVVKILARPLSLTTTYFNSITICVKLTEPNLLNLNCISLVPILTKSTCQITACMWWRTNAKTAYTRDGNALTTFLLFFSYSNMSNFVDQLFPPLIEAATDYSQFVYWREPLPVVSELAEVSEPSPNWFVIGRRKNYIEQLLLLHCFSSFSKFAFSTQCLLYYYWTFSSHIG